MARRPIRRICILSSAHGAKDDRIYHKQATSLAGGGYDVSYVAPHDVREDIREVHIIPVPRFKRRLARFAVQPVYVLMRALSQRADVYHFHDPDLLGVGVILKVLGRRVIYDVHEDYEQSLRSSRLPRGLKPVLAACWRLAERTAGRLFDHVIAADSHIAGKFPAHKTTVIANFPPLAFGEKVRRLPHGPAFRIVYVGGVSPDRGIVKAIRAMELVKCDTAEFHIAGDTNDPELLALLQRSPRVVYHGYLPWEEISALLGAADLGVVLLQPVPNYAYCSGEGIVKLFEYMSVGLPVLISNFPKLKMLIEGLDAGVAVDPTSPEAIAQAIDRLYDDPVARQRMGENGRKAVRERCNWEHEATKLLAIYRKLSGEDRSLDAAAAGEPAP